MRKTKFYAMFGLYDITAIADSTITTDDNSSLGNISLLKNATVSSNDYATLEQNSFVLDGSKVIMNNPTDIGFWSKEVSDEYGLFTTNPKLTITFTGNHSSSGLTFHFLSDYPVEMIVTWYTLEGMTIHTQTVNPDSLDYFLHKKIDDFGKIVIEFTKACPDRRIKLQKIEYGSTINFGTDESSDYSVKSAKLVTDTNVFENKISVNKLSFQVIDENYEFNFGNNGGLHNLLQYGQECEAYEVIDDVTIPLGKYFLTTFSSSNNVTKLQFQDYKGILADYSFRNGRLYNGDLAGAVIKEILETAGITNYKISDEVYNTPIYGYLKIQDCKSALKEVLFATEAIVDTYGLDYISIKKIDKTISAQIERTRKFSTSSSTYDYISSVSVKYPMYSKKTTASQIHQATYDVGTYTIDFSSPYDFTTISGATVDSHSQHSITFTVATSGTVTISGYGYDKEEITVTSKLSEIEAGQAEKNQSYTSQVINYDLAKQLSEDILDYLQMRLKLTVKFLHESEYPSIWAEIENEKEGYNNYVACMEEITIDLTGGCIVTGKCRGYSNIKYYFEYASTLPEVIVTENYII